MIFQIFSKKSSLKYVPGQTVDLEFQGEDGSYESASFTVRDVQKKKVGLTALGPHNSGVYSPGMKVRACTLQGDNFVSYMATVTDVNSEGVEISLPAANDVEESAAPSADSDENLDVTIPIEYRAMRMAYTQVAEVSGIRSKGLTMVTNVAVPSMTSLMLTINLAAWGKSISTEAKSTSSTPIPDKGRKHATDVEFENLSSEDKKTLWRYAVMAHMRKATRK